MRNKIGIIVMREFLERVKKKSFIITTILMPIFMVVMMLAPTLIIMFSTGDTKQISVIDESGIIANRLESDEEVVFVPSKLSLDSARVAAEDIYGVLYIGADVYENASDIKLYTNDASSISVESNIRGQIKRIIEDKKLKAYNIANINEILADVKTDVSIQTFKNKTDSDKDEDSSSISSYVIGLVLGLFLYMFLLIYGQMVMTSVIEEKNNRVLEVMVSSASPFQLMFGKILGVACVAVVQIVLWGAILMSVASIMPMLLPADIAQGLVDANAGNIGAASAVDPDMLQAIKIISNVGYILQLIAYLLLFLIGGFLLYAAMFAAVGSSVDNIQDASQLQFPITLPIILSLIIMTTAMTDPNSQLAIWCSMIPFTSPVVMMARIPFGIPTWQILLSLVILFASFVGMVWLAAKIYRVGIFMYGKKPTFKELIKWIKYK